jgi:short-subunit dehydrogenase
MRPDHARVLLTGATGGIGHAIARALQAAGAQLLLTGRSASHLAALAVELHDPARPDAVQWVVADLAEPQATAQLVQEAERFGVNVLVNNAGLPSHGRLQSLAPDAVRDVLTTNLVAPVLLTQALLPFLLRQTEARVIQVGSALGRIGMPGTSVYSASKFGLRGFSEALRRELAGGPVTVQYLGPRSTDTRFNSAAVLASNAATGTAMDDPARVARALLALLRSGAAERFIGFPETLAVRLNGLVPSWLDGGFSKHRRQLVASCLLAVAAGSMLFAPPAAWAGVDESVAELQQEWEMIRYQTPAAEREKRYERLAARAHEVSTRHAGRSEPLVWEGIIVSSLAGEKGGLGALSMVKRAKGLYEAAIEIDDKALDGSAYNSLGVLYYKVPVWPLGFGDKARARALLDKAIAINPKGIDPNFFLGEFLLETGRTAEAIPHLEQVLQAPGRPNRQVADAGRREEARQLLEKARAAVKDRAR